MKRYRMLALLLALSALLSVGAHAAQVYLPSPDEVGDYDTDSPVVTFYEEDGKLNTEKIPRPVEPMKDLILPSLLTSAGALALFGLLHLIRSVTERRAKKQDNEA